MAINKGNLRLCVVIHKGVTYEVLVMLKELDELDSVLQEYALDKIGENFNLPEELIENKDISEVLPAYDTGSFAYMKSPVSRYMDIVRNVGVSEALPDLPTALVSNLYPMPSLKVSMYSEPLFSGYFGEYTVEKANLGLSDGINFIGVTFNKGTPIFQVYSDLSAFNYSSVFPVVAIMQFAGKLIVSNIGTTGCGLSEKIRSVSSMLSQYRILSSVDLSVPNLSVQLASIVVSDGVEVFAIGSMDTTLAENDLYMIYKDASSQWQSSKISSLSNTQCQGAGLVDIPDAGFVVHHLYRVVSGSTKTIFAIPSGSFPSEQAAINSAEISSAPLMIEKGCVLVGRAIIEKGATKASVQRVQRYSFGI